MGETITNMQRLSSLLILFILPLSVFLFASVRYRGCCKTGVLTLAYLVTRQQQQKTDVSPNSLSVINVTAYFKRLDFFPIEFVSYAEECAVASVTDMNISNYTLT